MKPADLTPNFVGQRALILHRPHAVVDAIARQLRQLGVSEECFWPEMPSDLDMGQFDHLFYDADMGFDAQFPWSPGEAPMPIIALIGSEAPGRLAWVIRQGADAHLLKPVGSGGIFSALVIAANAFRQRLSVASELVGLRQQLACRQMLAEATAQLMASQACGAQEAYARLRQLAMSERTTLEAMAAKIIQVGREHDDRRSRA
jgi:AmiR/NasT family two-component response regulator